MKRKAFIFLTWSILLSILLSGCGGRTGTDTPGAEIEHMRSFFMIEDCVSADDVPDTPF